MDFSEKQSDLSIAHNVDSHDGEIGQSSQINPLNFKETKRHLLPRHIQLIAISGAIGTGLFVSVFHNPDIQTSAHQLRLALVLRCTGPVLWVYFLATVYMAV